jgi:hypothetical protein
MFNSAFISAAGGSGTSGVAAGAITPPSSPGGGGSFGDGAAIANAPNGSHGGNGGAGGTGGDHGAGGVGGNGGGGAGGTVSLVASVLLGDGTISTPGGNGPGSAPSGESGRFQYGHNISASLPGGLLQSGVGLAIDAGLQTPRAVSPYNSGELTPLIVWDGSGGTGAQSLQGGPSPYGYLPASVAADPAIVAARAGAPARAVMAFVRYDTGPLRFANSWRMRTALPPTQPAGYDMIVAINLTATTITGYQFDNAFFRSFPALSQAPFGPGNPTVTDSLAPGDHFALLIRDSRTSFTSRLGSLGIPLQTVTLANGNVHYLIPACGLADVGGQGGVAGADGLLDNNDFIVFIDYFFAQSPLADRGSTGGVPGADGAWDNNDFVVFIDQFFAGC